MSEDLTIKGRTKCEDEDFVDLIEKMVRWAPEDRVEAMEALKHPFIVKGLPKNVQKEHRKQMESDNPYNLLM